MTPQCIDLSLVALHNVRPTLSVEQVGFVSNSTDATVKRFDR